MLDSIQMRPAFEIYIGGYVSRPGGNYNVKSRSFKNLPIHKI